MALVSFMQGPDKCFAIAVYQQNYDRNSPADILRLFQPMATPYKTFAAHH